VTPGEFRALQTAPAPAPAQRSPSCVGGVWQHCSASQLKSYRECARRWWWGSVQGLRSPDTAATGLGRDVHAELEAYLKTGALPTSPIARAALEVAGPRTDADTAEVPLEGPTLTIEGVTWKGYIDRLRRPVDRSPPRVTDWKTTSDPRWAKTAEQLRADPQSISYGAWLALHYYGPRAGDYHREEVVEVCFTYTLTRGTPRAWEVLVCWTVGEVLDAWAALGPEIVAMAELARVAPTPAELGKVPATWTACRDFGGCPHRGRCDADQTGRVSMSSALVQLTGNKSRGDTVAKAVAKDLSAVLAQGASKGAESVEGILEGDGLTLYVGCLPVVGHDASRATLLDAHIEALAKVLCETAGVKDLALIDYGKGKGLLAAALREFPPRGVVIARGGPWTEVALEVLRPMATTLVEGVR